MPKPAILNNVVRFHREHNEPQNRQPVGQLHHTRGTPSLGFLRGSNMAAGYKVHVQTSDGTKVWDGTISEGVSDNYSGPPNNEGPAWFFALEVTTYTPDPTQDETIVVTVTVTDTTSNTPSNPTTAMPNPKDVP